MLNKKFPPLYLLLLIPCAKAAGYLLMADFLSYNNSLDSYQPSLPPDNQDCCFTQTNCSEDCITWLRFCFKDYQTVNNISDDVYSGTGCINTNKRATLSKPVEYIDFLDPPLDMKHNRPIPTFLSSRYWPGRLQLFVRAAVGEHIVEYFQLDFELDLNEPLNSTINGRFYGSFMTFTLHLSLTCGGNYYGENCSVYCKPESSERGNYMCLSNGTKECLPGYQDTSTDCTTCIPHRDCHPDHGYCEDPYECICEDGYTGKNCDEVDLCGKSDPCESWEQCVNIATKPQSVSCSPIPSKTPTTKTSPKSTSSAGLTAGIAASVAVLLLTLCILVFIIILALRRRLNRQTADFKGSRDHKNADSHSRESGLGGLMDNPMYEVSMKGTHLPLGKSPSLEMGVEYDVDNPLYMIGTPGDPSANGPLSGHNYDYATPDEVQPTSFLPLLGKEFEMYAEPDIGHPLLALNTSPYSHPRSQHQYQEPPPTPPPKPGPIYDDPLSLPELNQVTPANLENHYETAEDVLEAANDPQHTIYDSDKEEN